MEFISIKSFTTFTLDTSSYDTAPHVSQITNKTSWSKETKIAYMIWMNWTDLFQEDKCLFLNWSYRLIAMNTTNPYLVYRQIKVFFK